MSRSYFNSKALADTPALGVISPSILIESKFSNQPFDILEPSKKMTIKKIEHSIREEVEVPDSRKPITEDVFADSYLHTFKPNYDFYTNNVALMIKIPLFLNSLIVNLIRLGSNFSLITTRGDS
jgi:hypothetical protein